MYYFPGFWCKMVNTWPLLPLIADFSGIYPISADQLDSPWRQMGHQLVDKFKAFEHFGLAFEKSFGGCCPNNGIGSGIILDFLGTRSATDNILTKGLAVSFTE